MGWKDRWLVSLEVGEDQREGTQRSQRPWPTRGTCTETVSKHQPLSFLVCEVDCSCPSSLRSSEVCKVDWSDKKWAFLPRRSTFCSLLTSHGRCYASWATQNCTQVLYRLVLTWPSTWWLIVFPEKQDRARENCRFVDFGGGDWCRRSLNGIAVTGEAKALHNHVIGCLSNLHAGSGQETPPMNRRALWLLVFKAITHTYEPTHTLLLVCLCVVRVCFIVWEGEHVCKFEHKFLAYVWSCVCVCVIHV